MKQWWAFQEELQGNYKDTWSWVKRAGPDELPERRNEEWQDERTTNVVNEPPLWSSFSAFVMCGKCGATNTWLLQRMEWLQRVALEVHTPTEEICWVVSLPRIPVTTRMFTFLGLPIDPYLPLLLGRRWQPNKYVNIFLGLPNYTLLFSKAHAHVRLNALSAGLSPGSKKRLEAQAKIGTHSRFVRPCQASALLTWYTSDLWYTSLICAKAKMMDLTGNGNITTAKKGPEPP